MRRGRFKGLAQVTPTDQKFITAWKNWSRNVWSEAHSVCYDFYPRRTEKKKQKLILPTENETGRKNRSKRVRTNSRFRKAQRNEAAGVLCLSQSRGPEGKKWGMAERGRGYVAPLHQHVCSNAIAGFHRTKKTPAIQHARPGSPGVWTQLCSNYRGKPALTR